MNTVGSSECLLMTGYLLRILTRREVKGGGWIEQMAYMENVTTTIVVTQVVAEANTSSLKEGDELKCPFYRKGKVGWGEKEGVFIKHSWPRLWAGPCLRQILSWPVGTLDAQAPVRKAGGSAGKKPSWLEIQFLKCSALMGKLRLFIQEVFTGWCKHCSIAPWLLESLQKLQIPAPCAKQSVDLPLGKGDR